MKKIELGQSISLLANVGVIIGIVFVGIELSQNNELMAGEARATRLAAVTQTWQILVENPEITVLLVSDRNGTALTEDQEVRLNAYWMRALLNIQWQHQELPESTEWVNGMRRAFASYGSLSRTWQGVGPGARATGKDNFDADFVEFWEKNVLSSDD